MNPSRCTAIASIPQQVDAVDEKALASNCIHVAKVVHKFTL